MAKAMYLFSEVFDLKPTTGLYCGSGVLEYWSIGVLEYWSIGVLEYWSIGVLECWSVGVLELGSTANRLVSILRLMSTLPNVRDLLEGHIVLELESIDRLYLNG
jgi:hypothetical protein